MEDREVYGFLRLWGGFPIPRIPTQSEVSFTCFVEDFVLFSVAFYRHSESRARVCVCVFLCSIFSDGDDEGMSDSTHSHTSTLLFHALMCPASIITESFLALLRSLRRPSLCIPDTHGKHISGEEQREKKCKPAAP